jgi:hypothetical protein
MTFFNCMYQLDFLLAPEVVYDIRETDTKTDTKRIKNDMTG